jgi:hypothetical protein
MSDDTKWWLSPETLPAPRVAPALLWLVERGVVVAHRATDRRVRYRLAASCRPFFHE